MQKWFLLTLFWAGIVLYCPQAMGHGVHEHGVVHMNIVVEGKGVVVEVESPLANFLPFEHKAKTESQKKAVNDMATALKKQGAIVVLDGEAQCRQKKFDMASGVLEDATLFPARPIGQDTEVQKGNEHGDIFLEVEFRCEKPDHLRSLRSPLFSEFPAIREIEVQMVTPQGQRAVKLTPKSNTARW